MTPEPIRFVIAGTPRSGSTWLTSALNDHPSIECHGELLDDPYLLRNPGFAADPWKGLLDLFRNPPIGKTAVGFKLFYFQCWDYYTEHRGVLDRLAADRDLSVVFLTRGNLLRLVLSWETARTTGRWRLDADVDRVTPPRLTLDPADLLQRFQAIEEGVARLDRMFATHPRLTVAYEELFAAPAAWLNRIFELLSVDPRPVSGRDLRMETRTLREAIANYDQVAAALTGTRYEDFLADPPPAP